MTKPNIHVFYHHPCHDGFLAQLLITRLLGAYATITCAPLQHGPKRVYDITSIEAGSEVLFVDIAPHDEMLEDLEKCENVKSIHIWDHHIDTYTRFSGVRSWAPVDMGNYFGVTMQLMRTNPKTSIWFCNDISGCKLAPIAAGFWANINIDDQDVVSCINGEAARAFNHPIVVHGSDYDTWRKEYKHTDAVFAYYRNYGYEDVQKWHDLLDRITDTSSRGYEDLVKQGGAMIQAIESLCVKLADGDTPKPLQLEVGGVTYNGVVCNAYSLLANDLGQIFTERGHDFTITYNITPTQLSGSIRTRKGVPANEIARLWGGGGHAGSAGFGIAGSEAVMDWLKRYVFSTPTE